MAVIPFHSPGLAQQYFLMPDTETFIGCPYTVEPRYYVPRLQRFHPYNVHIPKSRISVMHYIFYRYRLQRTPLQRNFRYNVQISRKNMKNGLRYNVQRGSISAVSH